jgi:hypothetical protein
MHHNEGVPTWAWIAIAVGAFFVLGTAVALVVAATLGLIADGVSALHETDEWTELPITREADIQTESEPKKGALTA